MPGNPFDQFDAPAAASAAPKGGNPFDQFDAPKPVPRGTPAGPSIGKTAKDALSAAVEPGLALGTGAVAAPVSGLAGILGSLLPGPPGQGAAWTHGVGNAMTYQPRGELGRKVTGMMSSPFEFLAEGAHGLGGRVSDVAGPAAGAGTNALLQLLPQLAIGKGLSKAAPIPGKTTASPEVQMLADKGVTMTPGEIMGGGVSRAEQGLQSIPWLGDIVKGARSKGVEQFGNATIQDALTPIGEKLPKNLKGNEAIEYAREKLGEKYEELLPRMKGDLNAGKPPIADAAAGEGMPMPPSATFRTKLEDIRKGGADLPEVERGQLNRILDKEVLGRFDKNGLIEGDALKNIESKLSGLKKRMAGSDNYDIRELGQKVGDIQEAMRTMIEDANPGVRAELKTINDAYAKFKIAQRAAGSVGAEKGVFKPSQYRSAVRAKDSTKDKRAFSEGTANQQPLAEAGKSVLSDTLADSGTPYRALLMDTLLGGGAFSALGPAALPAALAIPALYSQPVLRALQRPMMAPPSGGNALLRALPYGAMQQSQIPAPPR